MAKEEIYTIPINDAFLVDCECPLCAINEKLEQDGIEFTLGNSSYMEDDVRDATNALGFCKTHYQKLYLEKNRLGVALILQTHMVTVQKELDQLLKSPGIKTKKSLMGKKTTKDPVVDYIEEKVSSCFICEKMVQTFDRYVDTLFYLWKRNDGFRELFKNSKGFCLEHFAVLYSRSNDYLNGTNLKEFQKVLIPLQQAHFSRVKEDIDWFVQKFDYRFQEEPWKNSKDALPRGIKKISGLKLD